MSWQQIQIQKLDSLQGAFNTDKKIIPLGEPNLANVVINRS